MVTSTFRRRGPGRAERIAKARPQQTIGFSPFKCMKNSATSVALKVAITMATATVIPSVRSSDVTPTVTTVRTRSAANTAR